MTDGPTVDSISAGAQEFQLAELVNRLIDDYGTDQRDMVHALVAQERDRFAGARIHAFVPILIERSVRVHLAGRSR